MVRKLKYAALALLAGLSFASLARAQQGSPIIIFGLGPQLTVSVSAVPTSGSAPVTIAFSATPVNGTPPYTYSWDFGDGSALGSGQTPSHTYTSAGTFTAVVTVFDSGHLSAQAPQGIAVGTPLTVTTTAMPTSGTVPFPVTFTSTPSGGTGTYTNFAWAFGDSGSATVQNPPPHTYTSPGTYHPVVTVTDSASHTATSAPLTITANPSLARADLNPGSWNKASNGNCPSNAGGYTNTPQGCFMGANWATLEPGDNSYDWSRIDTQFANIASAGSTFNMEIRLTAGNEGTPDSEWACAASSASCTPWLRDTYHIHGVATHERLGASANGSNPRAGIDPGAPLFDPVTWDANYQTKWNQFVAALDSHLKATTVPGSGGKTEAQLTQLVYMPPLADEGHNNSLATGISAVPPFKWYGSGPSNQNPNMPGIYIADTYIQPINNNPGNGTLGWIFHNTATCTPGTTEPPVWNQTNGGTTNDNAGGGNCVWTTVTQTSLTENYNSAWASLAHADLSCANPVTQLCFDNGVAAGFKVLWNGEISNLGNDVGIWMWFMNSAFPNVTASSGNENDSVSTSIVNQIYPYAQAHLPASGVYYLAIEKMKNTPGWYTQISPWATPPTYTAKLGGQPVSTINTAPTPKPPPDTAPYCDPVCGMLMRCMACQNPHVINNEPYGTDVSQCPAEVAAFNSIAAGDPNNICGAIHTNYGTGSGLCVANATCHCTSATSCN